tara:strand:+ start:41 stop:208 length:168 start_codon:yes stop_codon:yes gene_type:complete
MKVEAIRGGWVWEGEDVRVGDLLEMTESDVSSLNSGSRPRVSVPAKPKPKPKKKD